MKNSVRKRAFISAIAMLIVSAIVLTSSTFAWFSMAKEVNVGPMELNVTSPEGIQVSANTSNFTTALTVDEITGDRTTRFSAYEGNMNRVAATFSPVDTQFIAAGRLPVWYTGSINDSGRAVVRTVTEENANFVAFDLFVKVARDTVVHFGESEVSSDSNPDVAKAMYLGIANCGVVSQNATSSEIQSANPSSPTTSNHVNTVYQFDAYTHTQTVEEKGAAIPEERHFQKATATDGIATDSVFTNICTNYEYVSGSTNATSAKSSSAAYFNAKAGVNRVRVYLWMCGQDVDCANDVAGSTFTFNLKLTID